MFTEKCSNQPMLSCKALLREQLHKKKEKNPEQFLAKTQLPSRDKAKESQEHCSHWFISFQYFTIVQINTFCFSKAVTCKTRKASKCLKILQVFSLPEITEINPPSCFALKCSYFKELELRRQR